MIQDCFKARLSAELLIFKTKILHSHANKFHLHKKGFALGLVFNVRVFITQMTYHTVFDNFFFFAVVSDSNDAEDNLILLKEMREMTEDFFLRMRQVAAVLKARHVSELVLLRKLRGEVDSWEDDRGKDSKTHQALSADVQEFLRSRVGPSNIYSV